MSEKLEGKRSKNTVIPLVAALLTLPTTAAADLSTLEGLNEAQISVAQAVTKLCANLNVLPSYSDTQIQLLWACNAFIHTANAIQNSGPTTYSLDLTAEQMISVLSELSDEEATANGDYFTEMSKSAFSTIAARLRGLRRGGNKLTYRYQLKVNDFSINTNQLTETKEQSVTPFNSPWSYYLNGDFNNGNKEQTTREDAFDFMSNGLTLGTDYRLGNNAFIGTALSYSNLDLNIDYKNYDDGTNINTYNLSLYGSLYKGEAYINALFGFGLNQIENTRYVPALTGTSITNLTLSESVPVTGYTNATAMSLSLSGGSDHPIGPFTLSHYGQLDMSSVTIADYNEEGDSPLLLHVAEENISTFSFTLGTQVNRTDGYSFGVITEFIRLDWRHEFDTQGRSVDTYYVYDSFDDKSTFKAPSDKPDADYYSLGGGLSVVLPRGIQVFAYYEKLFDLQYYDNQFFSLGIRAEKF